MRPWASGAMAGASAPPGPGDAGRAPVMPRVAMPAWPGCPGARAGARIAELFFPAELTSPAPLQRVSAARAVCGRCPVGRSCLAYALRTGQDGIWGGITAADRRAMRHSPPGGGPGGT